MLKINNLFDSWTPEKRLSFQEQLRDSGLYNLHRDLCLRLTVLNNIKVSFQNSPISVLFKALTLWGI
jgi:hypothetical protein